MNMVWTTSRHQSLGTLTLVAACCAVTQGQWRSHHSRLPQEVISLIPQCNAVGE